LGKPAESLSALRGIGSLRPKVMTLERGRNASATTAGALTSRKDCHMNVRDTIVDYIEGVANERDFDHSSNLFESGLLTSLDVLSLVAFIEETFALEISGDDIEMETFGTIDGFVAMITAKQMKEKQAV
jgi:methoxymalonate biosynthesis acyl carrier protein